MVVKVYMRSGRQYEFPDAEYFYVRDDYVKICEQKDGDTLGYVAIDNTEYITHDEDTVEITNINSNIQ